MLSLLGPGDIEAPAAFELEEANLDPLRLNRLHTLVLTGVKSGLALHTLMSSDLPALRSVAFTSYSGCIGDLTAQFSAIHGDKITSLTYLHPREWPGFRALPPLETFEIHPNLEHLAYLLHKDLSHLTLMLAHIPARHPLSAITLIKWTSTPSDRFDPLAHDPSQTGTGSHRLMSSFVDHPPSSLGTITIDGFRWVRVDLGVRALQTGDSGEMRRWADKLRPVGVKLLDMVGKVSPLQSYSTYTANVGAICGGGDSRRRRPSAARGDMARVVSDRLDEDGG
jgi:hypothetical protein